MIADVFYSAQSSQKKKDKVLKYFIDTHVREDQTFPAEVTEKEFQAMYKEFEKSCEEKGVCALGAHINVGDGKAYCMTMAHSAEEVRAAHEAADFPYSEITEVRRITGMDVGMNSDD